MEEYSKEDMSDKYFQAMRDPDEQKAFKHYLAYIVSVRNSGYDAGMSAGFEEGYRKGYHDKEKIDNLAIEIHDMLTGEKDKI